MPVFRQWVNPDTWTRTTWTTCTTDCGTLSATATYYVCFQAATTSITVPWIDSTGSTFATMSLVPQPTQTIAAPHVRRRLPNPPPNPEAVERERVERLLRQEARVRAEALLRSHLTEQQRITLANRGWFIVEGGRSGTRYRIRASGVVGNVDVLEADLLGERVLHRLCAHCDHAIPLHDHLLAQKLMLEADEDDFLRIANRHNA